MSYLILSVFASTLIFIVFKLFDKYNINTQQAIILNYFVACASGIIATDQSIIIAHIYNKDWFYGAVILGVIFILVFNLMAITTQKNGLSVAAVAGKMSVAIPVVFGIIVYKESTGFIKITGIILGLVAVYMTAIKNPKRMTIERKNLIYPLLVFLGSGIIDTSIKFLETNFVGKNDVAIFSATIFGFAACIGTVILVYKFIQGKLKIQLKNIIAGIVLGIINYFSIYFLIRALRNEYMDSATVFTINNIAILLVSTIAGIIFFKEKIIIRNWIGIILAVISIVLVASAI